MPKHRRPIRLSLRKKLLFSLMSTTLFLGGLELALAALGVRPQAEVQDRTAGFSNYLPLFVESTSSQGEKVYTTAKNKLHWFNRQTFPKQKSVNTRRIFCLGGSTTYGHPYWDSTSFAGWIRQSLPIVDSEHQWEVINAGGISYGSYRVANLMEELAQYEPDLFIVYSVHNEFLERQTYSAMFDQSQNTRDLTALLSNTRLWTLAERIVHSSRPVEPNTSSLIADMPAEVDEELNHTIGPAAYHRDAKWREQVVKAYRHNLQRMIDIAQRSRAAIVFVTPTANEKDCSPFKSEFSMGHSAASELRTAMEQGRKLLNMFKAEEAQELVTEVVARDPQYAEGHYLLGRALLAQGHQAQALGEFRQAIDEDVCPLRAISQIDQTLRSVAQEQAVPLVDFAERLRNYALDTTGSSVFGDELFLDHVHPTIEINRQLSLWIIEELQRSQWLAGRSLDELEQPLAGVRLEVLKSINRDDEVFAIRNLAKVLHWSGKFAEAIPRARDVLEMVPHDPESRYIVASCLTNLGRTQEAIEEYELLFADGYGYPRACLPYGELLYSLGQHESAKAYLLMAILHYPKNAAAYSALAKVHTALGETKFAEEALEEISRQR